MNKCKSCGIDYNDHLGIEGTCKELLKAKKRIDELENALKETKDFCIWLTGCGYDFAIHDYFIKMRDKLLKEVGK